LTEGGPRKDMKGRLARDNNGPYGDGKRLDWEWDGNVCIWDDAESLGPDEGKVDSEGWMEGQTHSPRPNGLEEHT